MCPCRGICRGWLCALPTPLVEAPPLARALGLRTLHVKRDDLAGFAVAGNKARKLELLLGGAVARGCDVLLTGGGPGIQLRCRAWAERVGGEARARAQAAAEAEARLVSLAEAGSPG